MGRTTVPGPASITSTFQADNDTACWHSYGHRIKSIRKINHPGYIQFFSNGLARFISSMASGVSSNQSDRAFNNQGDKRILQDKFKMPTNSCDCMLYIVLGDMEAILYLHTELSDVDRMEAINVLFKTYCR
jgi:hypothetical protein